MSLNVHLYPSTLRAESRILRITKHLRQRQVFDEVEVFGVADDGLLPREELDPGRVLRRLPRRLAAGSAGSWRKALGTLEWSARVLWALRGREVACVNCHSLPVLPLSVGLKLLKGARLVYDTHELETETYGARGWRRRLLKMVERTLVPQVDALAVVNDAIGEWYRDAYGLERVWVVQNVPDLETLPARVEPLLRRALGIPDEHLLFLYQGILAEGRGLDALLAAAPSLPADRHLVFLGYGAQAERVQAAARRLPRVHFHPAVPPDELLAYTAGADVGLSLIENVCLSYYLCLPNKIFQYLACGVPVLASSFPVMQAFIDGTASGWTVAPEGPAVARRLAELSREEIRAARQRTAAAREVFRWDDAARVLDELYAQVGAGISPAARR